MKISTRKVVVSALALAFVLRVVPCASAAAPVARQSVSEAERVERLAALGKLWAAAKFFRPYLAYRDIDWDAAAVAAIPKVNAARDAHEYAAAVQTMLDALGNPPSRVVPPRDGGKPSPSPQPAGQAERHPVHKLNADGVLVVAVPYNADLADYVGVGQRLQAVAAEVPKARAVLREFIPRTERARDATEYHLAVAELTARTHDTHAGARSPLLNEHFGVAPPPFLVRVIEGVPVVTRLLDEAAARAAGVSVGDVVVSVDGEHVKDRAARLAKYFSASTPQALDYILSGRLLRGAEGSTAALVLGGAGGKEREVKVPRRAEYFKPLTTGGQRTGDVVKLLPGNIGYADLERLTVPEVDQMFERFKDTKAIIFDMRGYPKGTAWSIAPRLTEKNSVVAALFQRPVAMAPDGGTGEIASQSTTYSFAQQIPRSDKWKYKGRTVMLIDERAISQSEHSGLFYEGANGTKFVGSHTNGANGDVTRFCVPGGISVSLSGHGVRRADGRQLQRLGLVPDVEVKPTIKGVREGRDEVLERALEYLRSER